ncbi:LSAMP [Cordylochernes scorpioides]|uniref:LSAMP n=1 Tax=Cordylochernes scorpioides TaxID=51811 RepID=A0ABY6KUQ9_9ARAC|nr:LSAMP [Cordylochernes scorpioides]
MYRHTSVVSRETLSRPAPITIQIITAVAMRSTCVTPVPAKFDENATSSDTEVKENQDVHLRCSASGTPSPVITWRKESDKELVLGSKKVSSVQGEWLNITKANRLHMGAYLCIASNGVPPAVSKRIMLSINFAPMIWIPDQLVGAALGSDVTLHCNLESHPKSVTFWSREGGVMLLSNNKYDTLLVDPVLYKVKMRLRIKDLQPEDYGTYKCVAKNALGETEGSIRLYGRSLRTVATYHTSSSF